MPIETLIIIAILVVAVIIVTAIILYIVTRGTRSRGSIQRSIDTTLFRVKLPPQREQQEKEQQGGERDPKESIAVMEQFYASLAGLEIPRMKGFLYGQPHISFEIESQSGKELNFYVAIQEKFASILEKQIHSYFSDAIVERSEDYTIFQPDSEVSAAVLRLKKAPMFPIRTYQNLEKDPLNNITNTMSKLAEGEGLAVQILIRPARDGWQKKGLDVAQEMQQGKTLKDAQKTAGRGAVGSAVADITSRNKPNEQQFDTSIRLTPLQEETVKALETKASKTGFDVTIRIIATAANKTKADLNLKQVTTAFTQFQTPDHNAFVVKPVTKKSARQKLEFDYIFRNFNEDQTVLLNTEELTSIFHFPSQSTEDPNIARLESREAPPPPNVPTKGTLLGHSIYRGNDVPIYITKKDRGRHMYVIGKTGSGKSVSLANYIIQDIINGEGVCVVDPHGELVDEVLKAIPKERADDVVIFDPADTDRPVGLNLLEAYNDESKDLVALEAMNIMIKLFGSEIFGPRLQDYFRNGALTLMADNDDLGTLIDIVRLFTNDKYQQERVAKVTNAVVRDFWETQMAKTGQREKEEMLPFWASKFGQFITNSTMRNILGQKKSAFNVREIMDNQKILLISLSKGKIGDINMQLLGMIIITKIQMAALARADMPPEERKDFYLYVDEFQNFATDAFESILSEARKYKLSLTIAHQYIAQIKEAGTGGDKLDLAAAVFGNIGTIISMRVGTEDAEFLEQVYEPTFTKNDIANIGKYQAMIKLLIENTDSKPFNMHMYPPYETENDRIAKAIRELSRLKYGKPRDLIDSEILERIQGAARSLEKDAQKMNPFEGF